MGILFKTNVGDDTMALLTQKGADKVLRRIFETGGMTPDMEKDIERLRGELNERDGMLRRYGETYDGESDDEEWEFKESPIKDYREDYEKLRGDYEALVKRYNDRFFNPATGGASEHDTETIVDTSENDAIDVTIDDLISEE